MASYPKSFKSPKYPKFIQNSPTLTKNPKPDKVFPRIGLPNDSVAVKDLKLGLALKAQIDYLSKFTLCFSSDGNRGFWDIASMSKRGIDSCMRWSSKQAKSLVGTLVDPYAAIIYLTDGKKTRYGDQMVARAVVRLVKDKQHATPSLLVERIYLNLQFWGKTVATSEKWDKVRSHITGLFQNYLTIKTPYLVFGVRDTLSELYIPMTPLVDAVSKVGKKKEKLSYRDSKLEYVRDEKFWDPKKVGEVVKAK